MSETQNPFAQYAPVAAPVENPFAQYAPVAPSGPSLIDRVGSALQEAGSAVARNTPSVEQFQDAGGRLARGAYYGMRSVINPAAEGLAAIGDKLGITGGAIPTQAQTAEGNRASREEWTQNPSLQDRTGLGYMIGQAAPVMAATIPATGALASAGAVARFFAGAGGGASTVGRIASGAVGGSLQGGAIAAYPTEGSEGTASERFQNGALMGGAIGGAIPAGQALARGARNMFTGAANVTPDRAELARTAVEKYGIPLTMQDIQPGMPASKWAASTLDYLPFSGAAQRRETLHQAVNQAVARTFGGDAAGQAPTKITQEVIAGARSRIGGMYNRALTGATVAVDDAAITAMANIDDAVANSALATNEQGALRNVLTRLQDIAVKNNGAIPGRVYQEFRQRGSALDDLMGVTGPVSRYARDIKTAMDDAFVRSNPDRAELFQQANSQWRALRAIEPEVVRGAPGNITPLRIQNAANRAYPDRAWNTEPNALGDLGDIAQAFLHRLPESGTAPRAAMMKIGAATTAALSGAGGGAAVGGLSALPVAAGLGAALGGGRAMSEVLHSKTMRNALIAAALRNDAPTAIERAISPFAPYAPGMLALPSR